MANSRNTHVLHLIKTSEGATWAIRLLQSIKSKYNDITFSVVIPANGKHYDEYKSICESVYEFNFELSPKIFKNGRKLKEIVKKENPDIIHSWFVQTTLYMRLFLRNFKIPNIYQVVGPAHLENPIFRFFDIKSAQSKDRWIATSQYIFDIYAEKIAKDRLLLNYAYIDTKTLLDSKDKVTFRDLRKEFSISNDHFIIGTASYIYPPKFYQTEGVKGHENLLKAFAELLKKRDDIYLIIAGTSFGTNRDYENKLKKMAEDISKDKIIFSGKYSNPYEIMPNFNVFVYLSKSENLGGVYESLLLEIPTVSSNRGGLPELVINGKTGFCIDPDNTESVVSAIEETLENKNSIYAKSGKHRVEKVFDKESIIDNTYGFYKNIVQCTGPQ